MKINVLLIILVLLTCIVLSGCGTTVKEAEQTTPASTVEVDAEDTFGEQTVDQMTDNPEAITENENCLLHNRNTQCCKPKTDNVA